MNTAALNILVNVLKKSTAPRDPRGVRHDFHGTFILVFLGLFTRLAQVSDLPMVRECLMDH